MHNTQIEDWLKLAGGKENIRFVEHDKGTTTLVLKDSTQLNMSVLASTDYVADIRVTGNHCHLAIKDESSLICNTLLSMGVGETEGRALQEAGHAKKNRFSILHFVSDVFRPLMPAILGAAVIKILLIIITLINTYSSADSSTLMDSQTFTIFKSIGDSAFYLLPILVAVSTAYRLKSNIYVAASIGGLMFHPQLSYLLASEGQVHFMGVPMVSQPAFLSASLWMFLTILAASYMEKAVGRISPGVLQGILTPVLTLGVLVPLILMVLGPLGTWIQDQMPGAMNSLLDDAPIVAIVLLGATFSLLLLAGLHYWLVPIIINELMINGYSIIFPAMIVAYVAQAGAAFASGLRSKQPEFRRLAFWATGTALLGVPEPAMYAVNIRKKASFYAALLGGAAGGLYYGLVSVKSFVFSESVSLLGIPFFMETDSLNVLHTCIGMVIAFCVSGLLVNWQAGRGSKNRIG
ncbi:PTS transporter subunit EIIC [Paenibacillus sp. FSL R5-0623]|uniref:PTS transporter subunit EIIC n=1 Tax=Paenibacillus sp. FSL R5-0623 TaxID=2921651 RepID=UPI0030DBA325